MSSRPTMKYWPGGWSNSEKPGDDFRLSAENFEIHSRQGAGILLVGVRHATPVSDLRPGVQRMLALFIEFVLDLEACVIGLRRANSFDREGDPIVHVPFAQFFPGHGAVARIVVWKTCVPPNPGVHRLGYTQAFLVGAGFACSAVEVDEVRTRDHGVGGFVLAGMVVDAGRFFSGTAGAVLFAVEDVNHVVVRLIHLRLREKG